MISETKSKRLEAILEESSLKVESNVESSNNYLELDIDSIVPDDNQPRKMFDDKSLFELSESIKNYGLLQPIIVRKNDLHSNSYIIIGIILSCHQGKSTFSSSIKFPSLKNGICTTLT